MCVIFADTPKKPKLHFSTFRHHLTRRLVLTLKAIGVNIKSDLKVSFLFLSLCFNFLARKNFVFYFQYKLLRAKTFEIFFTIIAKSETWHLGTLKGAWGENLFKFNSFLPFSAISFSLFSLSSEICYYWANLVFVQVLTETGQHVSNITTMNDFLQLQ